MADSVRGVHALQEELAKAKESLNVVDENIKKLTGREPGDNRPGGGNRRVVVGGGTPGGPSGRGGARGTDRKFTINRRSLSMEDAGGPPAKRRNTAFSRLGPRVGGPAGTRSRQEPQARDSGDEEDNSEKHTVQSSVVTAPKDSRTRQDAIRGQTKDSEGTARNRRMFGLLLGTLQRFQKDAKDTGDKEKQRQVIEEKLDQRAAQEKEDIRQKRINLFKERNSQQEKLKKIEHKMELVQIHEEWETQTKRLMNFIRTKAKPPLFYLPKTHTPETEKKLKETGKVLEDIITKRRRQLEEEIEELTGEKKPPKASHDKGDQEEAMNVAENGKSGSADHQKNGEGVTQEEVKKEAASQDPVPDNRQVETKERKSADKENQKDERRRRDSDKKDDRKTRGTRGGSGERDKSREGRRDKSRSDRDRSRSDKRKDKDKSKHEPHDSSRRRSGDRDRSKRDRKTSRKSSERSDHKSRNKKDRDDRKDKERDGRRKSREKKVSPKRKERETEAVADDGKIEDLGEIRMEMMPDLDSIALPAEPVPVNKEVFIDITQDEGQSKAADDTPATEHVESPIVIEDQKEESNDAAKPQEMEAMKTEELKHPQEQSEQTVVTETPLAEVLETQKEEKHLEKNEKPVKKAEARDSKSSKKEKKKKKGDEESDNDSDSDSDSSSSSSSSSSSGSSSSSSSSSSESDDGAKVKKSSKKSEKAKSKSKD